MATVNIVPLIFNNGAGGYAYDSDFDVDFMHLDGNADPFDASPKTVVKPIPSYMTPIHQPVSPFADPINSDSEYYVRFPPSGFNGGFN